MPIEGCRLYTAQELMVLLGNSKQALSQLAIRQGWEGPEPGLYWASPVEAYLLYRGIDPITLPVRTEDFPECATFAERRAAYDAIYEAAQQNLEDD